MLFVSFLQKPVYGRRGRVCGLRSRRVELHAADIGDAQTKVLYENPDWVISCLWYAWPQPKGF